MSYPAVRTRAVKETTNSAMNSVADYVLYDTLKNVCCVVGEVKSEIEDAEQQNVYQMLACFRKDQTVMLGFTVNRVCCCYTFINKAILVNFKFVAISYMQIVQDIVCHSLMETPFFQFDLVCDSII